MWQLKKNGIFTVKSTCALIDDIQHPRSENFGTLLQQCIFPPKIEMFMWLLLQDNFSTRGFLVYEELLIMMMLVLFVVWKLRPLITFLLIDMRLGGFGIVLCNGLGMMGVCQRLFYFFCRNGIICYMENFNAKPSIRFVVVSCSLFGLPLTNQFLMLLILIGIKFMILLFIIQFNGFELDFEILFILVLI